MDDEKTAPGHATEGGSQRDNERTDHTPPGIVFSRFGSPTPLSKTITLEPDGTLTKSTSARLVTGTYERIEAANLAEFASVLQTLTPHQALAYGVARAALAPVVCKSTPQAERPPGAITRSKEHFGWSNGPGLLMLDYDPPKAGPVLSREELLAALHDAVPALAEVGKVWVPSAGSCIVNAQTGEELVGVRGQRIYVVVERACDIPTIGKRLVDALWVASRGRYDVSKAGTLLARTLVDASVWQPERLDFVGGAVCNSPLQQRRAGPLLLPGAPILRLADVPVADQKVVAQQHCLARAAVEGEAQRTRQSYIEERAPSLAERRGIDPERARETIARALNDSDLLADFELLHSSGETVTVGEVLDDPDRWHGERFADPVEPDYRADGRIAWVNLRSGGRPFLWSHAHGGRRFFLHRQRRSLQLQAGELSRIHDECASILALCGDTYTRGGEIVELRDTALCPLKVHSMRYRLGCAVAFQKLDGRSDALRPVDAPTDLARMMLDSGGAGFLAEVRAVITAPTIFPDGRVLDVPGYDKDSGLLYVTRELAPRKVPHAPTRADALAAAVRMIAPFKHFPFVDDVARGVLFAALMTAVMRPTLPTAPGILIDAPTAGSGKTLLGTCLAALCSDEDPATTAPASDDEEMRKRLFSFSRLGVGVVILDNVVGHLESPALCEYLTSPRTLDRILGESRTTCVPNTAMFIATGNNAVPVGDLNRRLLRCRIDSGHERPDQRAFAFDPLAMIRERRAQFAVDVCTILAAFHHAGAPRVTAGGMGSFDDFSNTIRQTVLWLASIGLADAPGGFTVADPARSIETGFSEDPDQAKLAALLSALYAMFGTRVVTVAEMQRAAAQPLFGPVPHVTGDPELRAAVDLRDALDEIAGENGRINPRRLGRWIERHKDRPVNDLRFNRDPSSTASRARWSVTAVSAVKAEHFPPLREVSGDSYKKGGNKTAFTAVTAEELPAWLSARS